MNPFWSVIPPTEHAGCIAACPGCRHRSLAYPDSLRRKQQWLSRALAPWRPVLQPARAAPAGWRLHYRDRVCLHARWDDGWAFGLLNRDALIPAPDCPVHHPRINRLAAALRRYLPGPAAFPLAYLACTGRQATLVIRSHAIPPTGWTRTLSLAALDLDALWLNRHPSAGRRLFAKRGWTRLLGTAYSVDDNGLRYGPEAFRQLVAPLHRASLERAEAFLEPGPGDAILDLYCGVGTGLARWQRSGGRVLGVELGGEAVTCARQNAPGVEVLRGACATRIPQIQAWLTQRRGPVVAYANPPRTGLEPALRAWLSETARPRRLAYLSCSAGTLSRDLTELEASGYRVEELQPYDFFPGTDHVETLALLSRWAAAGA
ncbi:MAG: class I SAM-dependent RNA methyltransferase [Ectothiorhodospiraceae bacterium]|nr:class I SAM-dependent RNA methyltransferase [Ectothiorhodospiraceae bacterium]